MNREEAKELLPIITAYAEGKDIEILSQLDTNKWVPLRNDPIFGSYPERYRIKPEPKKRLMTRNEVLGYITNTSGIVVKGLGDNTIHHVNLFTYTNPVDSYEWATISKEGVIGEWRKFETDDTAP